MKNKQIKNTPGGCCHHRTRRRRTPGIEGVAIVVVGMPLFSAMVVVAVRLVLSPFRTLRAISTLGFQFPRVSPPWATHVQF